MKSTNTGKSAESAITALCFQIERMGWGRIEKVDPPTRVIRANGQRKIIYLSNPFLDHIGVFRGQPIVFEVKDVDANRLPLNRKDGCGLSVKQCQTLRRWDNAGALTGLVWFRRNEPRLWKGSTIIACLDAGWKSLPWDESTPVEHFPDMFNQLAKM